MHIKDGFAELYCHMKEVAIPDMDGVIDTVCTLCWEHEKTGFVEGVKVGIRLAQELSEYNTPLQPTEIFPSMRTSFNNR